MKPWKPFIIICGICLRDRNHFYYHLSSQAVAQAARRAAEEEARLAEEEALLAGTCLANYRALEVVCCTIRIRIRIRKEFHILGCYPWNDLLSADSDESPFRLILETISRLHLIRG